MSYVIVRTDSEGVHFGILESQRGQEVVLSDARRIWRWAGTLSELSLHGADQDWTRISEPVPAIKLLAIEIIPCTMGATENLKRSRWGMM